MFGTSAGCTIAVFPSRFFWTVSFFVRMCLLKARFRLIFPDAVSLNRFLALEFVFILGITSYILNN
jgi:hypothetical protein